MTRNQLKLQIWNLFNDSKFSDKVLIAIQKELSDDELGAFVDLLNEAGLFRSFINTYNTVNELEEVFSRLDGYKEMANRYLETLANAHLVEMRRRVLCNRLEDCIKDLGENQDEEAQLDFFSETSRRLLAYLRVLRAKIDAPQTDIYEEEKFLLDTLGCDYEGCFCVMAFAIFMTYMEFVVDAERVEEIFSSHKPVLEFYLKEMQESKGVPDYIGIVIARNDNMEESE